MKQIWHYWEEKMRWTTLEFVFYKAKLKIRKSKCQSSMACANFFISFNDKQMEYQFEHRTANEIQWTLSSYAVKCFWIHTKLHFVTFGGMGWYCVMPTDPLSVSWRLKTLAQLKQFSEACWWGAVPPTMTGKAMHIKGRVRGLHCPTHYEPKNKKGMTMLD